MIEKMIEDVATPNALVNIVAVLLALFARDIVVGALRASGPGWQTRVNAALKDWLAKQPVKRKQRGQDAA